MDFQADVPFFLQHRQQMSGGMGMQMVPMQMNGMGMNMGMSNGMGMGMQGAVLLSAPASEEVERFIRTNNLDERAAKEFRHEGPSIQRNVMDKGMDLSRCVNPSSAVIGRIREAKKEIQQ